MQKIMFSFNDMYPGMSDTQTTTELSLDSENEFVNDVVDSPDNSGLRKQVNSKTILYALLMLIVFVFVVNWIK